MTAQANLLARALEDGKATGMLPPDASLPVNNDRPWPVTLLTALGAWLAAVPFFGVVFLGLGDVFIKGWGPYVSGGLALVGATVVLRVRAINLFVEQLAAVVLFLGVVVLTYGLPRDVSSPVAAACLALLTLGLAIAVPQVWLRVLLGFVAAGFTVVAAIPNRFFAMSELPAFEIWLALHVTLLVWVAALAIQHSRLVLQRGVNVAAALESISTGWLLLVLCGLCGWSGMTFMVGGSLGGGMNGGLANDLGFNNNTAESAASFKNTVWLLQHAGSVVMAGAAGFVVVRSWPSLRQAPALVAGLALCALCWFSPALGAAFLALAVTASSHRWRLAAAAAVAAAWIIGSFYYQLNWTLANKAVLLVALGAVVGASAWWAARTESKAELGDMPAGTRHAVIWMALGVVLTLGVANVSIWQKEKLIATGQKVFVELTPADPRSLMQGDYMRLNYRLLNEGATEVPDNDLKGQRPYLVVQLDALGVATFVRVDRDNLPLAATEQRLQLTPKDGRWTLVSDAWFFREGDARLWEAARYGEFRVAADGTALLVGLADEKLQAIAIQP